MQLPPLQFTPAQSAVMRASVAPMVAAFAKVRPAGDPTLSVGADPATLAALARLQASIDQANALAAANAAGVSTGIQRGGTGVGQIGAHAGEIGSGVQQGGAGIGAIGQNLPGVGRDVRAGLGQAGTNVGQSVTGAQTSASNTVRNVAVVGGVGAAAVFGVWLFEYVTKRGPR